MTIIQPNKSQGFVGRMLVLFSLPLVGGVLWLVVIYNQTVNLEHAFEESRHRYEEIQAVSAELKNQFFTLLGSGNLERLAEERRLVKEKQPVYLEIPEQWAFASQ